MLNQLWIVVNIGCIECSVSSNIVGVFTDKRTADDLAAHLSDKHDWREGGQNSYEVFPMPEINVVNDEYRMFVLGTDGVDHA
jgi:hypothetical protein